MPDLDAVIIGAGHNGLVCAAYLGMAGLRVRVVERRGVVGGAAVTEEFHPGFRNSTAAYTVSLLQPKVIRDLNLHEHGLRIVERRAQNFLPLPDGRYLLTGEGRTEREIAKFSAKDAARYPAYQAEIGRVAGVLRGLVLKAPPNVRLDSLSDAARELGKLAAIGRRLWQGDSLKSALRLFRKSAGDTLDRWFESDPIKAVLGFDAVVGNLASPYTPGSAYVLLHHTFGEVNGKPGVWGHAIGGMGADHPGHGEGRRRARRPTLCGCGRARSHRRARPRRRSCAGGRHADPGARSHRQCQSATSVSGSGPARGGSAGDGGAHEGLEGRLRDIPHECRACRSCRPLPRCRRPATITPPASSWRQACPTWTRPTGIACNTAGAAGPSSKC